MKKITPTLRAQYFLAAAFISVVPGLVFVALKNYSAATQPGSGPLTRDLFSFWSGFQLLLQHKNPYDVQQFRSFAIAHGGVPNDGVLNPPWFFLILTPFCWMKFETVAPLWAVANIFFAVASGVIAWKLCSDRRPSFLLMLISTISFIPIYDVLNFGQMSLLVTYALYQGLLCIKRRQDFLAAFLFCVASIKPQLFWMVALTLPIWAIYYKRWRLIVGVMSWSAAFFCLTCVLYPGLIGYWMHTKASSSLHYTAVSLVSPIQMAVQSIIVAPYFWVGIGIPAIASVTLLFFYLLRGVPKDLMIAVPWLLIGSVLCAPYIWIFDHVVLMLVQVAILAHVWGRGESKAARACCIAAILIYQSVTLAFHLVDLVDSRLFWYPLPLLVMLVLQAKERTETVRRPALPAREQS